MKNTEKLDVRRENVIITLPFLLDYSNCIYRFFSLNKNNIF